MNIHITAILKSKPEFQEELKQFLQNLVEQSQKETACLGYTLHQSIDDEDVFYFYEIWENEDGVASHNEQPHFQDFIQFIENKLQEAPIIIKGKKIV